MSRAGSIWLVYGEQGRAVAAFTVRHELVSWLKRVQQDEGIDPGTWHLEQLKDGPWGLHCDDSEKYSYMKDNWKKTVAVETLL